MLFQIKSINTYELMEIFEKKINVLLIFCIPLAILSGHTDKMKVVIVLFLSFVVLAKVSAKPYGEWYIHFLNKIY